MDRILMRGMSFYGYHGALPEEQVLGQPFTVDLALDVDLRRAGKSDAVEDSVHYGEVYNRVRAILEGRPRATIEAVAEAIVVAVYRDFPAVQGLKVRVEKPKAPVPGLFQSMAVELNRPAPARCYIALGSNMGDRAENLADALRRLQRTPGVAVIDHSSWYATKPVGVVDQEDFLNGAASLLSWLTPQELLALLLETEAAMGRVRLIKWGPRLIDLDLLLYGDAVVEEENLMVPHPYLSERRFVLVPLAEIAPDHRHPGGPTTRELLERLPDKADVVLHVPKASITI
ncbi:2-amino-4-hydroxy-6-hydroxymethyldihydropteridine diphosphokinase [Heliobacterium gestii]|uniref:Bifunctional folate synthesis protein n=1 Tax=Heliomicrobium gestii TaxID=2699 RepID=A0A845LBS8_HELGE|nr:2-amino-4-hydroxy-6-hydroxymethyldihydropteridine diphosphokinase [Heliomicrobium gestii]MBM7866442.1 dihydroneopterin aldolase/2-amino-4-hydroxy-6-hydroxymethyldihydropteridine diphosphokinase [Heliomicrobium gestii]MZP42774.1 2-amino-4-hydroxy-6-hydroxymethyldihydropteridine diphosphokinase [Heliomicrobium gestii]